MFLAQIISFIYFFCNGIKKISFKKKIFITKSIKFLKNIDNFEKIAYNKSTESKKYGGDFMELAKVTTKGQITIPKSIRDLLDLKEGSKILFIQKGNDVVIQNSAMLALEKIQKAFEGEAERLGLETEEDVVKMIKEFRKNRKKE